MDHLQPISAYPVGRVGEFSLPQQPKVLILEDDMLVASSLRDLLSLTGCEVTGVAASVNDALSFAQGTKPDLALIDVHLTGPRDGIEGAELLYQQFGIPVIFLTGDIDKATARRASGIGPYLTKPVHGQQLVEAIRGAMNGTGPF
jgi:DNA-binding NarL/FixJ family response regulator